MKWYLVTLCALTATTTIPVITGFRGMVLANFQAIVDAFDFANNLPR